MDPTTKMTELAQSSNSDWFSAKSAVTVTVIGTAILAVAGQLETIWGWNPARSVFMLSLICASPFALREYYSSSERLTIRIGIGIIALLAAWNTLFQTTRGSSSSYELPAPSVPAAPLAMITGPVPGLVPDLTAISQPPFRPMYRWNETGYFEVLVVFKGSNVWMQSVQDARSRRF